MTISTNAADFILKWLGFFEEEGALLKPFKMLSSFLNKNAPNKSCINMGGKKKEKNWAEIWLPTLFTDQDSKYFRSSTELDVLGFL